MIEQSKEILIDDNDKVETPQEELGHVSPDLLDGTQPSINDCQ